MGLELSEPVDKYVREREMAFLREILGWNVVDQACPWLRCDFGMCKKDSGNVLQ